jgi:hypothetical protein
MEPASLVQPVVLELDVVDNYFLGGSLSPSNKEHIMNVKILLSNEQSIILPESIVYKDIEEKDLVLKKLTPSYSMKKTWKQEPFMAGFIQGDGATGQLDSKTHKGIEVLFGKDDGDVAKIFGCKVGKVYEERFAKIAKKYCISSKKLPERPLSEKNSKNNDFLAGLFSANGSVNENHRVSFKCSNEQVVNMLMKSLKSKGIECYKTVQKASKVKFDNGTYKTKESYILNIGDYSSIVKFASKIGFAQKYKQKRLAKLIKSKALKAVKVEKTFENISSMDDLQEIGVMF